MKKSGKKKAPSQVMAKAAAQGAIFSEDARRRLSRSRTLGWSFFALGLLLLSIYFFSVRPLAGNPGYAGDMCDMTRHIMSDTLRDAGQPRFQTDVFMTPHGDSIPYLSWQPERDWLGAQVFSWDHEFPFFWVFFGVSLLVTYFGVGFIVLRMGLSPPWAWAVTTAVVLFHVPRHFKIWHHFEHLPEHWVYLILFLDAWIYQRFWRERRWSLKLEIWRGFLELAVLGSAGYFWGPTILEWFLVRAAIFCFSRRPKVQVEIPALREIILPLTMSLILCCLWARWYIPLFEEVKKGGQVYQGIAWFAKLPFFFRPLWLEFVMKPEHAIDSPETVVTVGWFYWIPFLVALFSLRKKRGGAGLGAVLPFLVFLVIGILYATLNKPFFVQTIVQAFVPFMSYFRVASRWGLFLPQLLTLMTLLAWPELTKNVKSWFLRPRSKKIGMAALAFYVFGSALEWTWLFYPVNMMPPMRPGLRKMLDKIHDLPGTSVLDLPFCVAGGNGVCTERQCPNYPSSVIGQCLSSWHDKKIYGLYASRMLFSDCEIYNRPPYLSWFQAWGSQRCFSPQEWDQFCGYLDQHTELSAILVYPDIWWALQNPRCAADFTDHLGEPLGQESSMTEASRGGAGRYPTRVVWYAPRCVAPHSGGKKPHDQ